MSEKIDPWKDNGVYVDGEWVSIMEGVRRIRAEQEKLEKIRESNASVSMWDRAWVTILSILLLFIIADLMEEVWTSSLELSSRILLTFTVLFTSVVIGVLAWVRAGG